MAAKKYRKFGSIQAIAASMRVYTWRALDDNREKQIKTAYLNHDPKDQTAH